MDEDKSKQENLEQKEEVKPEAEPVKEEFNLEAKRQIRSENSAINNYLNSYSSTKKSFSSNMPKRKKKKVSRAWMIYTAAVLLVLAFAYLAITGKIFTKSSVNEQEEMTNAEVADFQMFAAAAANATPDFFEGTWQTSAGALNAISLLMNPGLPDEMYITYENGNSYATAGTDGWGHPFYITAMQTEDKNEYGGSLYDFYITSAGKNGKFDYADLKTDEDDIPQLLLSMADYVNTGRGTIETVTDDEIEDKTSKYDGTVVPIALDKDGGIGGSEYVSATYNEILPTVTTPQKEGFIFQGYFEEPDGQGYQYYDKNGKGCQMSKFTDGVTLYAYWTEKKEDAEEEEETAAIICTVEHYEMTTSGTYPSTPDLITSIEVTPGTAYILKNAADVNILSQGYTVDYTTVNHKKTEDLDIQKPTTTKTTTATTTNSKVSVTDGGFVDEDELQAAENTAAAQQSTTTGNTSDNTTYTIGIYYSRQKKAVTLYAGDGIKSMTGTGSYYVGSVVTIQADVQSGYIFEGWTGDKSSTSPMMQFTMPANDVTITANAKKIETTPVAEEITPTVVEENTTE